MLEMSGQGNSYDGEGGKRGEGGEGGDGFDFLHGTMNAEDSAIINIIQRDSGLSVE